ncbi:adenylate/guanylate cyclase domain-containing protein [Rhodoferax sp.]|uniref:adenylate/guanylate cyclase domain-containing protein n=1 Tax=Rhodoferax sp. TaxID=50421 RepID=UPI00374D923D
MVVQATVVFADLTGSTAFFEALGNEKATRAVTRLTQWISDVCEAHHGRVVKKLGDGVLAVFVDSGNAANAVIAIQRGHQLRLLKWPATIRMEIKAGIARGEVVEVDGDCYGDAVNVASRLSDLSGANQIWVTESVVDEVDERLGLRFVRLGPVNLRGRAEAVSLYKIEWQEGAVTEFVTMPAGLAQMGGAGTQAQGKIHLVYLNSSRSFLSTDMPVHLGRGDHAEFFVDDPRVSRLHARIEWRNGAFFLTDLSSFGTWVRFTGSDTDVPLRRDDCQLHATGEIALGMPFNDISGPTVHFTFAPTNSSFF